MNLRYIIILTLLVLICGEIYSIDTTAAKYYPMVVGNIYVYRGSNSGIYTQVIIQQDSVFNGHRYYKFKETYGTSAPEYSWQRVDSATTNLLSYSGSFNCTLHPFESITDSLAARKNDNFYRGCDTLPAINCSDTNYMVLFGISSQKKVFVHNGSSFSTYRYYLKNIGLYRWETFAVHSYFNTELRGFVLNGILYGDTTRPASAVNILSNEIPSGFALLQNYPNPFNPATKIKFEVPEQSRVSMVIYDITGGKIEELVDETLQAATYEVDFDASALPSGVYIYHMEGFGVDSKSFYSQSMKMVVLK